jgi:hypothetical protein
MKSDRSSFTIDREQLFALLGAGFSRAGGGTQPNPDGAPKPGPWDPVIRVALKDLWRYGPFPEPWRLGPFPQPWHEAGNSSWRKGPHPEPWRSAISDALDLIAKRFPQIYDVIGGGQNLADKVALNPQPLPPRERFITTLGEALIDRAEQLAEAAGAIGSRGEEQGIIVVGGYVNRLVDDWCGTGYRPKWPFPGPPPWWFVQEVAARDTLILAATLHHGAQQAYDPVTQRALEEGAEKLVQSGLNRSS